MFLSRRDLWLPTTVGVVLCVLCYMSGALLSGGGHTLVAMLVFFPYGITWAHLFEDTPWVSIAMILLVVQFPLYANFLARAKGRVKALPLPFIFAAHTLVVLAGFSVGVK